MDIEGMEEGDAEQEILEILVDQEELDGAALGIAKLVLAEGTDILTGPQRDVYDRYLVPHFSMDCSRCSIPLPKSEIPYALEMGDELCSACRDMDDDDDDE